MSELEDKLNKILSSPEDMEKIMGMARSLSGSLGTNGTEPAAAAHSSDGASSPPDISSLTGALGSIDPKMIGLMSRIMGEYSTGKNDKSALLTAIKPYLKEDRRSKIDKAAEIARLAHLAKIAFSEFSGGGEGV